jgi:ankyrin repeat protein
MNFMKSQTLFVLFVSIMLVGCNQHAPAPDISVHDAVEKGEIEVLKQHLAAGTDVNARDNISMTPLHWAVGNDLHEIVSLLLNNGADVDAKNEDGMTPLFFSRSRAIAGILISKGAEVNEKDDKGGTPLHALTHSKEIAELLIKSGANVNAKNEYGFRPLTNTGNKETFELLLANGANPHVQEGEIRMTPLHSAAWEGNWEIVELLLSNDVDTEVLDARGMTALMLTISSKEEISKDLASISETARNGEEFKRLVEMENDLKKVIKILRKHDAQTKGVVEPVMPERP